MVTSGSNQRIPNFLSNASKFTPVGAHIRLSLEQVDHGWEAAVRDHGSGVPAPFREALFERFSQVNSSNSRLRGGAGIGLSICRAVVTGLSGSIGHHAPSDGGARFWFAVSDKAAIDTVIEAALPGRARRPALLRLHDAAAAHGGLTDQIVATLIRRMETKGHEQLAQVLHVEDDPDIRRLVRAQLGPFCAVTEAVSCAKAAALLSAREFDVEIFNLPDGRGETLLSHVRFHLPAAPMTMVYSVEDAHGFPLERVDATGVKSSMSLAKFQASVAQLIERRLGETKATADG
ncbi:MAG: CheY-like chemotaxis protein [Paracoccaceae bacterium]|jgi:CheY-like chemotaxis protein